MTDSPDRPTGPRPLDRAPGERYRGSTPPAGPGAAGPARTTADASAPAQGSARRGLLVGLLVAAVVAIGRAVVGQLDLGPGALAIGAFGGWVVALALISGSGGDRLPRQPLIAALLGGGAILVGLVLEALLARLGTGVLGPIDYINARYGLLAYVEVGVAAALAAIRGR